MELGAMTRWGDVYRPVEVLFFAVPMKFGLVWVCCEFSCGDTTKARGREKVVPVLSLHSAKYAECDI